VAIGMPGSQPPKSPEEKPADSPQDKPAGAQDKAKKADQQERKMPAGGPRDAMTEKAVNDAAAYIRSLGKR
jgi:hypothetical protein